MLRAGYAASTVFFRAGHCVPFPGLESGLDLMSHPEGRLEGVTHLPKEVMVRLHKKRLNRAREIWGGYKSTQSSV